MKPKRRYSILGLLLALATEFLGISITSSEQIVAASGIAVLEVIPIIRTRTEQLVLKKRIIAATVTSVLVTIVASCAFLLYRFRM